MNDNIDSELEKALRRAERRFRIASDNYLEFSAKVRDAGESNTIPASYNHEWCKTCAEVQKAEAVLNKIVDSIVGSR